MAVNEYLKKHAGQTERQNAEAPAKPTMTNGIPNSVLNDVLAGRRHATGEMMGHRQNLAESVQAKMSQAFGMDFSRIRLYRSEVMSGADMKGISRGDTVVLSQDVDLNTGEGQAVLGHELSHIHAQSQGIGMGNTGLIRNAALEQRADREGILAARGMPIYSQSMNENPGMRYGLGMKGMEGLTPLSGGIAASAGVPMQAKKSSKESGLAEKDPAVLQKMQEEKQDVIKGWGMDEYADPSLLSGFSVEDERAKLNYSTSEFVSEMPTKRFQKSDMQIDKEVLAGTDMRGFEKLKKTDPEEYEQIRRENIDTSMSKVQSRRFYQSMNQKERLAMLEYTSDNYRDYNNYLRSGLDTAKSVMKSEKQENKLKHADKLPEKTGVLAGALNRYEAPYDLTVWRAIGRDVFEEKMLGRMPKVNDMISDQGFMSASTDKGVCENWGARDKVILEIEIPKGAHVGAPIGDMTINQNSEHEFLITPGTQLLILDMGTAGEGQPRTVKCRAIDKGSEGREKA